MEEREPVSKLPRQQPRRVGTSRSSPVILVWEAPGDVGFLSDRRPDTVDPWDQSDLGD